MALHLRKDADSLERVQRRRTKRNRALENMTCKETLRKLGLFSLERKKLRENMITAFKYFDFPHWIGDRKQSSVPAGDSTQSD